MILSKIIDGVVVAVINVDNLQYVIDNPERYGDAELYIQTDPTDFTKPWGRVGYHYDAQTGTFSDPEALTE